MSRPSELTNQYFDTELEIEIKRTYGSLLKFAKLADIDYPVLRRVVKNMPCKGEDIDLVIGAWIKYSPERIKELINEGPKNFNEISFILLDILACYEEPTV